MNVRVVVLRSGMILLVKKGEAWGFVGGTAAPGEAPGTAAVRLLKEQLGVEGTAGPEAAHTGDVVGIIVPTFSGEIAISREQYTWVEAKRLLERDIAPADRPIAEAVAAHRRRDRYRGTHPREFKDKYKELAGEPEAVAKAKARGSTPAGGHVPIMVDSILAALAPLPGATVLDCTLGAGGHAEALARAAGPKGRVIGLDRDGEELERTREKLAARGVTVTAVHSDYAEAREALDELGVAGVDALFADLGVSSMQLDRPERGMSFKSDGPLDMRMDRSRGETAAAWLARASEGEIAEALRLYGDEPDAEKIASKLAALAARGREPKTTRELAAAVTEAKGLGAGRVVKKDAFAAHPATRTFQALRIVVNGERESLKRLLADLPRLLKPGGRAAFLTFHSGEEACVKAALDAAEPLRPSPAEVRENPRARSARLWRFVRR